MLRHVILILNEKGSLVYCKKPAKRKIDSNTLYVLVNMWVRTCRVSKCIRNGMCVRTSKKKRKEGQKHNVRIVRLQVSLLLRDLLWSHSRFGGGQQEMICLLVKLLHASKSPGVSRSSEHLPETTTRSDVIFDGIFKRYCGLIYLC